MTTTEEECLDALREAAERLGHSPSKSQYEALEVTPSSTTILRIVGGWNEAKRRAGLYTYEQDENGGRPVEPAPDWVTVPKGQAWSAMTAQQRWYYRNRDHRIETKERRRVELREWFSEVKQTELVCSECTEERGPALDFHHPGEKSTGVSQMVNHGYSKSQIREEMEKCVVLCANCHREEHYAGPDLSTLPDLEALESPEGAADGHQHRRHWLLAYKRAVGGCSRCAIENPACIDLHHRRDKSMAVSKMLQSGYPWESVYREIQKCTPLCVNCHRVEHHGCHHQTD